MGIKCLKCGKINWGTRLDAWKSCSHCGNIDESQIIRIDKADLYVNRGKSVSKMGYLS